MNFTCNEEPSAYGSRTQRYKITPENTAIWQRGIISSAISKDDISFIGFLLESVSSETPLIMICESDFISKLRLGITPLHNRRLNPKLIQTGNSLSRSRIFPLPSRFP